MPKPTRDDLSDDPDVLRRGLGSDILGHCLLMAHHHKAGWRTLVPGWLVSEHGHIFRPTQATPA